MSPIVRLWDLVGLGLIVEFPTGIHYSNQTGGTSCRHPTFEGIFVPLANDFTLPDLDLRSPAIDLFDYFAGPKHGGAGATRGLDEADAAYVESVLQDQGLDAWLRLDRDRLGQSHGAWVHVTIEREPGDDEGLRIFSGLGPYPRRGVLTWANSD